MSDVPSRPYARLSTAVQDAVVRQAAGTTPTHGIGPARNSGRARTNRWWVACPGAGQARDGRNLRPGFAGHAQYGRRGCACPASIEDSRTAYPCAVSPVSGAVSAGHFHSSSSASRCTTQPASAALSSVSSTRSAACMPWSTPDSEGASR